MGTCIMPQVFVIGDEPIGEGDYLVRYIDYDGTILKEKRVDSGGSVTPPTAPTHDGLTFDEWTATSTNVTSNLDIRAVYYTTDGKTMLGLRSTVVSGLDVVLYLNKSDGSTLTVDWGDGGANSTFNNSGDFNTGTHTYSTYGDYQVKMWVSSGSGTYGFGNGSDTTVVVGGSTQARRDMLLYAFVGENVTSIGASAFDRCYSLTNVVIPNSVTSIGSSAFKNCRSLTNITIPNSVTSIGASAFYYCYSLTSVVIPNGVTSIGTSMFNNCYSLTSVVIPNSVISIGISAFNNCYLLTSVVIPNSVTSIGEYAFQNCYSLTTYIFERTAGITAIGGTNAFENINTSTKIYVPDELVDDYKIADNWSTYANYIYPISDKGVTHND